MRLSADFKGYQRRLEDNQNITYSPKMNKSI